MFGVRLGRFSGVMFRVAVMAVRGVSVVRGLFVVARFVMLRRFTMMLGRVFEMLSGR